MLVPPIPQHRAGLVFGSGSCVPVITSTASSPQDPVCASYLIRCGEGLAHIALICTHSSHLHSLPDRASMYQHACISTLPPSTYCSLAGRLLHTPSGPTACGMRHAAYYTLRAAYCRHSAAHGHDVTCAKYEHDIHKNNEILAADEVRVRVTDLQG